MSLSLSQKALQVKPSSTLAITAKAKELKASGIDVVGFGAGEPDFDTPDNIKSVGIQAIQDGFTKYTPASGTQELKEAICRKFKSFNHLEYQPNQIVVSNGGKHSLTNVFTAILNPGDEVIIPTPYWLSYPEIVKLADGVPVYVEGKKADGYKVTADMIEAAVTEKTKAFILNTPSNPTGMVYTRAELQAIAELALKYDFYVVSDEMYENLVYGGAEHISIASLGEEIYQRTITVCGLAKGYAMTGWRIGYTGSNAEIAKLMGSVQSHQTSNPNSIAQKAAVEALDGSQDTVGIMLEAFNERREYIYRRINEIGGIGCLEPVGAFYVFIDISGLIGKTGKGIMIQGAADFAKLLIEHYNVAVIPCEDFGCPDHIRLSYAISIEQIEKGLNRIEAAVKELA